MSTTAQNTNIGQDTSNPATILPPPPPAIKFASGGAILAAILGQMKTINDMMKEINALNAKQIVIEEQTIEANYKTMHDAAEQAKNSLLQTAYASLLTAGVSLVAGLGSLGMNFMSKYNTSAQDTEVTNLRSLRAEFNNPAQGHIGGAGNAGVGRNLPGVALNNLGDPNNIDDATQECMTALRQGRFDEIDTQGWRNDGGGGSTTFQKASSALQGERDAIDARFDSQLKDLEMQKNNKLLARQVAQGTLTMGQELGKASSEGAFGMRKSGYDFQEKADNAESTRLSATQKFSDDSRQGLTQMLNTFGDELKKEADAIMQALTRA